MFTHARMSLALFLAGLSACVTAAGDDAGNATVTQQIILCPDWQCGSNSPELDHQGFHELNLYGAANAEGFALTTLRGRAQIYKNNIAYDLRVTNGKISGWRKDRAMLSGQALYGAQLRITRWGAPAFIVAIARVREIPYFVDPNGPLELESYVFQWITWSAAAMTAQPPVADPNARSATYPNLCNNTANPGAEEKPGLYGMLRDETVLFEGDRIDSKTKTIEPEFAPAWFNLGCAGHTLSKVHLTGNSSIWDLATASDRWEARQATLKMLVADYCNVGIPFTVAGEPLLWHSDLIEYWATPDRIEARWTSKGPTCLNEPRLLHSLVPMASQVFPNIIDAIREVCELPPPCKSEDFYDFEGTSRISANPPAPY